MTAPVPNRQEVTHSLGEWSVVIATGFGPRIVDVLKGNSPSVFARLDPAVSIPRRGGRPYIFHGGHRLWAAPEEPSVSYAPDGHECQIVASDGAVTIKAPRDSAGLVKTLEIRRRNELLQIAHYLKNTNESPLRLAGWGISQFRLGGWAMLPSGGRKHSSGLQADRTISVWPYTELSDPRISWARSGVEIKASAGPRLKLGAGPDPRRLGYLIDGFLFTKTIESAGDMSYVDKGAVGQVFVDDSFCELESVGPLTTVLPGESITTTEAWDIATCPDLITAWEMIDS